ncbi:hypothetical protein C7457_1240 [Thermovibrio guaymasensis]|uniref:PilZ domain-containing protein n=1 Tax=Thermovibrio guaymasensis TaxID=240167 RepID=A0A420W6T3_9BACT|nr:hypothetical protein [Thermovibrio guaymasensis]RKQ61793.1 hypothetical protein C7457_1240 [Thermovibrio guaymasensis]
MTRKDGISYIEEKCEDGRIINLPLFFSFHVEEEEGNRLIVSRFLPPGIEKHLLNSKFYVLKDFEGSVLIEAQLKISNGKFILELLKETFEEKRVSKRLMFCPEDLGEFELWREGAIVSHVKVLDISLSGIRILVNKRLDLSLGELLILTQGTKIMNIQVIRVSEKDDYLEVGAKIFSTNFNLITFLSQHYVETVKKFL